MVIDEETGYRRQYHRPAPHEQPLHLGVGQPFGLLLEQQLFCNPRHFCRIFESNFDLNTHGSPAYLA